MLPSIQLYENSSKVTVFWDLLSPATVASYNLYWSNTGDTGTFVLLRTDIPNFGSFGKKYTAAYLDRAEISLSEKDSFYLAITSVSTLGAESPLGTARLIPYLSDQNVDAGSVNSPVTVSENKSLTVGGSALRLTFTHDAKLIEIFNNTDGATLYVDVTGFDATTTKSMPVYSKVYYTIFRNLNKDTGVSLITDGSDIDARIVVHY
jgi:hypothetical protein